MNNHGRTATHPPVRSGAWAISALVLALACDGGAAQGRRDGGAPQDGSADGSDVTVRINIQINNCPNVTTAASPLSTSVGDSINVVATATDQDPGDRITYQWTAASGSFADPKIPNATYTCAEPGTHAITVRVSDGRCDDIATLPVMCSS